MKWNEAIAKIDWDDSNQVDPWTNIENLGSDLGLDSYSSCFYEDEVQQRVKKVWLERWLCTDTMVGAAAYFLDKELIAISWQPARKSDEVFDYASAVSRKKMKDFLISFQVEDEFTIADLDEEIPAHYTPKLRV